MKTLDRFLHTSGVVVLAFLATPAGADECHEMPWCSEHQSHAFNNMLAGAFGEMFEMDDLAPFLVCGFQLTLGEGGGITGAVDCSDQPCRAVLYRVLPTNEALELNAVVLGGLLSGVTDFVFEEPTPVFADGRYAVVLETADSEWGLWQCCNAGENCCPGARPVHISDGVAIYNDPSGDDYAFSLRVEDLPTSTGEATWGRIKRLYFEQRPEGEDNSATQ